MRVLSLVEGRIVEVMLGVRMPRRPTYAPRGLPLTERIKQMFTDPRTWSTLLYMGMMLPLGIIYFTVAVTGLCVALGFIAAPIAYLFDGHGSISIDDGYFYVPPIWGVPVVFIAGVVLLFAMLHLARGVGYLHGQLAKHLLVKST